jgi:hypothetical protein
MAKKIKKRICDKIKDEASFDRKLKMSEVIADFAKPLLKEAIDDPSAEVAISMAVTCWNLSSLPKDEHDKMIKEMKAKLSETESDAKIIESIARMFIERKKAFFSHIKNLVVDYDVKFINGKLHLNVVSTQNEQGS